MIENQEKKKWHKTTKQSSVIFYVDHTMETGEGKSNALIKEFRK